MSVSEGTGVLVRVGVRKGVKVLEGVNELVRVRVIVRVPVGSFVRLVGPDVRVFAGVRVVVVVPR